jgi:hypothetical protein
MVVIFLAPKALALEGGGGDFPDHVVINEVLGSNTRLNHDRDFGAFSDWIELYNPTGSSMDLSGWHISDNPDNPDKWRMPHGTVISPGGYLLLWADGKDLVPGETAYVEFTDIEEIVCQEFHLNFRINREQEEVLLYNQDQEVMDRVYLTNQERDYSFGRDPGNPKTWCYMGEPTPGLENSHHTSPWFNPADTPVFSFPGGLYPGSLLVELGPARAGSVIRYTTDGSEPTTQSPAYRDPIEVHFSRVIKARMFEEGKLPGEVVTQSYIIDKDTDLPVISLSTDHWNLWDFSFGLYQRNLKNREVFAHMEYFDENGHKEFQINAGLQLFGSQVFLFDQKPFSLFFRRRYGQDKLNYRLFEKRDHAVYTSLVLRNGGNDNNLTMFRDGLGAVLVENQLDIDYQSYKPVVVYMNGEYWGIFNLREKLNEEYLEANHGVNPSYLDIIEDSLRVNNGDANHYTELIRFVSQHDLSRPENFEVVSRKIDLDEFINYMSYKIYGGYIQWQVNNKYWRERTPDSPWRWIAFDLEHCFAGPGSDTYDGNTLNSALEPGNSPVEWPTLLFRKLMENEDFRARFIQRTILLLNTVFREERVLGIIDSLKFRIGDEMEDHISRWGSPVSLSGWNQNIELLKEFARNRNRFLLGHLMEYAQIQDTSRLTIHTTQGGKVVVCSSYILVEDSATLTMLNRLPFSLVAMPEPGYRFSGWSGINPDPSINLVLTRDTSLIALFERRNQNQLPDTIRGSLILDDTLQPYYATGNVVIPPGDSMILREGVTLLMTPRSSLVNYGSLQILGGRTRPVIIKSNPHQTGAFYTSDAQKWGGLIIQSSDTTRITHTILEDASSGLFTGNYKGAITAENSILLLKGVNIEGPENPIYGYQSQVVIDSCKFSSRGTGDLINLRACSGPVIRNNDLKGNFYEDTDAIDLDSVNHARVEGNFIYSFFGSNSDGIDLGEGSKNIQIHNNRIFSVSDKGISVGQASEVEATNNLIVDCNQGFGIKDSESFAKINQNTLHNNRTGIACFEKNAGKGGGRASVENTIISNSVIQSVFVDELSSLTISYCLSDKDTLMGYGNLLGSPLFAGASNQNFYLEDGSPCIDRGMPDQYDPDGTRADIGAYIEENGMDNPKVVISEINFNAHSTFDPGDWIELFNGSAHPVDLAGWVLKGENPEDEYAFPDNLILQSGSYLVIVEERDQVNSVYGGGINLKGNLNFGLNREGEVIKVYNNAYQLVHSLNYGAEYPWPDGPDGKGATLELFTGERDNSEPGSWYASRILGGTPGARNSETTPITGIFINEFMAKNDRAFADEYGEYDDWIEIYNANEFPVSLGGMNFVTGKVEDRLRMIPLYDEAATTIEAHDFMLFWADKDPEQGILHLDFNLRASGGVIGLAQKIDKQIYWIDHENYGEQTTDIAFGRYPDGSTLLTALYLTPGSSNIMSGTPGGEENPTLLRVYPNPADHYITVELDKLDHPVTGELRNINGLVVKQFRLIPGEPAGIDISELPAAIYLLRICTPSSISEKILIF